MSAPARRIPAPGVPLCYLALAHLCLIAAVTTIVVDPLPVAITVHHPTTIAVVHLITLGWITGSILGSLYLVVPMAMGAAMAVRRADRIALWTYALGASGVVSHFWLWSLPGMAWSALLVIGAGAFVLLRARRAVAATRIPREVRLVLDLAGVNFLIATGAGVGVGLERIAPRSGLAINGLIAAHAHLALLGFAAMTFVAVGYRLLPMLLPARPPAGPLVWASAVLMEIGVLGLGVCLALGSPASPAFAGVFLLGFAAFGSRVVWMLGHRKPPPRDLRRPDLGTLQVALALVCAALAGVLGLAILLADDAAWTVPATAAYGALLLLGFFGQAISGVGSRLFPMFAWLSGFAGSDYTVRPPPPNTMSSRPVQAGGVVAWALGVTALCVGLYRQDPGAVRAGAVGLLAGALCSSACSVLALRHTRVTSRSDAGASPS